MYSNGTISGFVRDNRTNLTLANVTVVVGSSTDLTNASGEYFINTLEGRYQLVGIKEGYDVYIGTVDIYAEQNVSYNFSEDPA